MHERKVIGILVLLSALVLLGTCQLQFNNSAGNSVALQIVLPGNGSGGGKAILSGARSLAGGTSLAVTMTGATGSQQQSVSINGQASIDISFSVSSGTYQVTAQMFDGSGTILSIASAPLTVPTGNYPFVLTMPSNLLSATLVTGATTFALLPAAFSPTTYLYSGTKPVPLFAGPPTLTLTTVDPAATLTVTEAIGTFNFTLLPAGSPSGSSCILDFGPDVSPAVVTITVTGQNGPVETYTMTIPFSLG
jgi:hypothetical protein